jgi:hypothetical protein
MATLVRFYYNGYFISNGVRCKKFFIDIPYIGCFGSLYNPKTQTFEDQKHIYKEGEFFDYKWIEKPGCSNVHCYDVVLNEINTLDCYRTVLHKLYSGVINGMCVFAMNEHIYSSAYKFFKHISSKKEEDLTKYKSQLCRFIKELKEFVLNTNTTENDLIKIEDFTKTENDLTKKVRKQINLAKMLNSEGFSNFMNGNFYEYILNSQNSNYIIIDGINVYKNRVKFVDVYTEPPVSNADVLKEVNA